MPSLFIFSIERRLGALNVGYSITLTFTRQTRKTIQCPRHGSMLPESSPAHGSAWAHTHSPKTVHKCSQCSQAHGLTWHTHSIQSNLFIHHTSMIAACGTRAADVTASSLFSSPSSYSQAHRSPPHTHTLNTAQCVHTVHSTVGALYAHTLCLFI